MEFLLFLNLLARISHLLAWPLITLVYPLYASIRAIEKNSLSDSKKCLTYWVISGLIMLFEVPFGGIVYWIPFWPYVKLVFNLWFVVDHFGGAVYAYDHFIRPCLSVNVKTFGQWLRCLRVFDTGNSDTFLLVAKRFVQENGSDSLEKLISDKVKCEEPNLTQGENNSVHSGHIKQNTDRNRVEMSDANLIQSGHKATTEGNIAESSGVQSSIPINTQMEWTCALCQVCVSSEITLQKHLKGSKHKAKLEMVRTPKKWKCTLCQIYTSNESSMQSHIQGKKHKEKEMEVLEHSQSAVEYTPPHLRPRKVNLSLPTAGRVASVW